MLSSGNVSNSQKLKRLYAGVVGRTWTQSNTTLNMPYEISCQDNGSSVFATLNGTKAIYRSKNYGQDWDPVNTPYIYTRTSISSDGNSILTTDWGTSFIGPNGPSQGRIWVSSNNGTSWVDRRINNAQYQYMTASGMSNDATKMYVCLADDFGYPELYGATSSPDAGVYKSTDGGATWTRLANSPVANSPGGTNNRYSLASIEVSANGNVLYGSVGQANTGKLGKIYRSTDGGANWTLLTNSPEKEWWWYAMSSDGSIVYAVRYNTDYIYRSLDQGNTWESVSQLDKYSHIACSADGKNVFATTTDAITLTGKIYTSNDYGANWIIQPDNYRLSRGVCCSTAGDMVYESLSITDGYIYRSYYV